MNIETLIYGFSVTENLGAHRYCIDEHCLVKGVRSKGACLTANLAQYLSLYKSIPLNQNSDWSLLNKALKNPDDVINREILNKLLNEKIRNALVISSVNF